MGRVQSGETSTHLDLHWPDSCIKRALLNPNIYDNDVDGKAANPGAYLFQKMTCWFYLGEIARVVLLSLVERSPPLLFNGEVTVLNYLSLA